jgi:hypothetical protein
MTTPIALLRAAHFDRRLDLFRGDAAEPLLTQHAEPDHRPYLHPLRAPDGRGILTEDAPAHHPWQHGLYTGLNEVGGAGFWKEGGGDGTFHPRPLAAPEVEGHTARWTVETEWRAPAGRHLLTETQRWQFIDEGRECVLDLQWTLRAEGELTFGQYAYGGLFLRMPYRKETGGEALNSEGQRNAEAEARRARWVAVSMPIAGRDDGAGIAMMDHPANPEHPVPWRVDGQLGVAPSRCIAGPWQLAAGETARFRHRLLLFCGTPDVARIEASWRAFAERK